MPNISYIIFSFELTNMDGDALYLWYKHVKAKRTSFSQVEQIQLVDIYHQVHASFVLIGIGNFVNSLPKPLVLSYILY